MNVREILSRHKAIDAAINSKLEQITALRNIATRVTREISASAGGGAVSDKVGGTAARIADLDAEINRDIDRLVEIKEQIRIICGSLNDETQRTLIERRYILHEEWEDIADKMGYSPRHIARLHASALERLDEIYGDTELIA